MNFMEKTIIRFYAANTFMFDHQDEKHYSNTEKNNVLLNIQKALSKDGINMPTKQIKEKYKYLRDIFVKTDKLIEAKQNLTYLQKGIYQKMYFIKPFLVSSSKPRSTYEVKRDMKVQETASKAVNQGIQEYFISTKRSMPNKYVHMLNEKLQAENSDRHVQRMKFFIILKSIRIFKDYLQTQVKHAV
ncbi:uncharacterized protein LOC107980637 [Nasonia vitripennis]|uniref:MADF domain-containing protein n=1 Tax=Nasonia vitripennis TaxID=7425 RepID=A0A7M7IU05_NASVI|nr:uncharacterized protein LOC107980637 [Nasonia vitripennis]